MSMNMKRFMAFAVCLVLAVGMCSCALAGSAKVSTSEAWDMAFALVERETGISRDLLRKGQIVYEDGVWGFSVVLLDPPEDEDGLYVGEMDNSGNLIELDYPSKINLDQQLERELKACFHRENSYLYLADVCAKWNEKLASVSREELDKIWPQYVGVVRRGITVPPDNVLDIAAARRLGLEGLVKAAGWTEDMPGLFVEWVCAYYVLEGTPVYYFGLSQHSWLEDAYSTDAAMAKYDKELEKAFSAVGQKDPRYIGIVVNAVTGELYEKPMMDYAPIQFNYLDFLIRTEEAVASISK